MIFRNLVVCDFVDDSSSDGLEQIHSHSFESQLPPKLVFPEAVGSVLHHLPGDAWFLHPFVSHYSELRWSVQVHMEVSFN